MIRFQAAHTEVRSTSPSNAAAIPYYVKGLALGVPPYFVAVHFWTWVLTLPIFLARRADFRELHAANYMVRTGHAKELFGYRAQKNFQDRLVSQEQVALPFFPMHFYLVSIAVLILLIAISKTSGTFGQSRDECSA